MYRHYYLHLQCANAIYMCNACAHAFQSPQQHNGVVPAVSCLRLSRYAQDKTPAALAAIVIHRQHIIIIIIFINKKEYGFE